MRWKHLIARALNHNQYLILKHVAQNRSKGITELLQYISHREGIALSTLKVNGRILRSLELIEYGEVVTVTNFGARVLSLLSCGDDHG